MKKVKKTKILYVLPSLGMGGMETFCFHLLQGLDKSIFEIHFALMSYNTHDHYEDLVIKSGGIIHKTDKDKYKNKFKRVKEYKKFIYNLCKEYHFTAVHVHACSPLAYISCKTSKKAGVKTVILHSHASDVDSQKLLAKIFMKKSAKWSDYHFACGVKAGEWMFGKHFFNLPGSYIINNAFNTSLFEFNEAKRDEIRKLLNINENQFVIGMVSRLSYVKNHAFIISIMRQILSIDQNIKLLIVGNGPELVNIKKLIDSNNLVDNVILVGEQSNIADYLSSFDCYVMPSFNEGLPTSAIEAQTSGLSCILSDSIDHNCDVTGNVKFLNINEPNLWIDEIINIKNKESYDRKIYVNKVKQANYDISDLVKFISRIYLD